MKRLRQLCALLSCLAAMATGTQAFAGIASLAMANVTDVRGVPNCQHCPDCDGNRCPQAVDCVALCAMPAPALAVASIELPLVADMTSPEPSLADRLVGERPPPDPLPPRR